ncbi:hypothetical protein JCM16358_06900 [Halanaerocella petrolearia]
MEELAEKLKNRRQELGLSLQQVAEDTNIKFNFLEAIEAGEFHKVGPEVYLKGFLKIYSDYLNLDAGEVIDQFERSKVDSTTDKKEETSLKDKLSILFDQYQNKLLAGVMVLIVIMLLVGMVYLGSLVYKQFHLQQVGVKVFNQVQDYIAQVEDEVETKDKAEVKVERIDKEEEESVITEESSNQKQVAKDNIMAEKDARSIKEETSLSEDKTNQNKAEEQKVKENKQLTEKGLNDKKLTIKVKTIAESWYSVQTDGSTKYRGVTKKGKVKTFSGNQIKLKIGNAAGVQVIKSNKVYGPFGSQGEIVTKVFSKVQEE